MESSNAQKYYQPQMIYSEISLTGVSPFHLIF
jgi:hypothetical protein